MLTQVFLSLMTGTSLIDPSFSKATMSGHMILISITMFVIAVMALIGRKGKPRIAIIVISVIAALLMIGGVRMSSVADKGMARTNANVNERVLAKYGITVLENAFVSDVDSDLNDEPLWNPGLANYTVKATDSEGQQTRINIEFIDNDTDVIVLKSGKELPRNGHKTTTGKK